MVMSKRQAGVQITKDHDEEEDWGRDEPPSPVKEASAEVLATRKIALPKSRRKAESTNDEEAPRPNPFSSSGPSTTAAVPKANPFATLGSTNASATNFSSKSAENGSSSAPVNAFSFGLPASSSQSQSNAYDQSKNASEGAISEKATTNGPDESDYDSLLRMRSINVAFSKAIQECIDNDAFGDYSPLFEEYKNHRKEIKDTPISDPKSSSGINIYPSFAKETIEAPTAVVEPSEVEKKEVSKPVAPSFSFNASAPAFSFGSNRTTDTTKFGFGAQTSDSKASAASGTSKVAPTFTFGQPAAMPQETRANPEAEIEQKSKDDDTPQKSSEFSGKDFSWTPDRGIKFGESVKTTEGKTSAPVFGFNNPLASPSSATAASEQPQPAKPAFSFGSSGATGFSFGQAASSSDTTEKKEESAPTKAPTFNFNSSTPTFSFGQSTTPTFSFSANQSTAPSTDATKESTPALEESKNDEADGDAMPDEPRTNDALIAGPGVGEEDEDQAYSVPRAKLFKFNPDNKASPWTDLGICVIRILVHKETKKSRIVARAEGAGALRLNARMYPHFKYTQEGKQNVKVYEMSSPEKNETYLIKIRDTAVVAELVKVLNEKKL